MPMIKLIASTLLVSILKKGKLPSYLADDCRLIANARERRLHTKQNRACVVTQTHSSFGDRAYAAASPRLWNSLPSHLRDGDLVGSGSHQRCFCLDSGATAQCEPI